MCLPLYIYEPWRTGWQYSTFLFLGINVTAVFLVTVSYAKMFTSVRKTRKRSADNKWQDEDAALAARCFLIVFTNVLSWTPIFIVKILGLSEIKVGGKISFTF